MQHSVADAHVDVLMRMLDDGLSFYDDHVGDASLPGFGLPAAALTTAHRLQASHTELRRGGVMSQVFAIFVSPQLSADAQLLRVLQSMDCFFTGVVRKGGVHFVQNRTDLEAAHAEGEIAGLLSLEGAGALSGDPAILRMLFRLGVRGVGLTWNPANALADGCAEPRSAGLSTAGRRVLEQLERLPMWLDLAHLGDGAITDALSRYGGPVMASHANARAVHLHPRNLSDAVITEIIGRQGWIGLTFESSFLTAEPPATWDDLARHIDHVLALGGSDSLGFGSDFDGGIRPPQQLPAAGAYAGLAEWLVARYGPSQAVKLLKDNFHRYLNRVLA